MPTSVPPAPRASRHRAAISGAVVIGAVGAAVLLAGVVMLLVLAAQHGYFGPSARVLACGGLAVALVIAGLLVRRRQHDNVGAVVLAGAGLAAGYLDITAMTWLMDVPVRAAVVAAGLLALAGLALSWWWGAELLGVIATLGALILVPAVSAGDPLTSATFLLLLTAVTMPASWRDGWHLLLACRVLPTAIYLSGLMGAMHTGDPRSDLLRTGAVVCAAIPFVDWWLLPPMARRLSRLGGSGPTARTVQAHGLTVVPLVLPLWVAAATSQGWWAVVLAVPLAVVAAVHWYLVEEPAMVAGCTVATAMAALAVPIAALNGDSMWICLAVLCLAFLGIHRLTGQLAAMVVGCAIAALLLVDALPRVLGHYRSESVSAAGLAAATGLVETAAIVAALLAIGAVVPGRVGDPAAAGAMPSGGAVYSGGAVHSAGGAQVRAGWIVAAVASACLLLRAPVADTTDALAILAGHPDGAPTVGRGLSTLCAAVIITVLLMRSRGAGRDAATRRVSGYVLMGLVVTKLFLHDLVNLDGVVRVIAFIGVGLLMLLLATAYSRSIDPPAS
ncbi:DUF2339 domain-containing protein [Acidipropionibacterium thoenii]|uniref:DUF2339 domain-containing protein n=1 Tax=Acidipropionibacterium thoenii TaxID=1751 RepID=UPI000417894A|nr:DUF2339 domain-containing protein [Acidipropionibacterium thoenii]